MQTFLPYPSFARSAAVLDDRRLGKQRVEALQILRALHLEDYGWAHHPAVLMWRGRTRALVAYGLAVVAEWRARGRADATAGNIAEFARPRVAVPQDRLAPAEAPPWLGCDALHRSHRAALVRKAPEVYAARFPGVSPDAPYVWPDPPAGPLRARPFSAWVIRPVDAGAARAFAARGTAGVPRDLGGSSPPPKARRQLHRWREQVAVGDAIVLVDGDRLRAGVVAGVPLTRSVHRRPHLVRPVVWHATMTRAHLRRPWQLQDPQVVFALRGEPAVARVPAV